MAEEAFRNYYGKNYDKVRRAAPVEIRKMKRDFAMRYPAATLSKFDFGVTFAKDGTVDSRDISYKVDDLTSYDITSDTFLGNPEWTKHLYWVDGWRNVADDAIFRPNRDIRIDAHKFRVYVTEDDNFLVSLKPINPVYTPDVPRTRFITDESFDYKTNPYFRSLAACYVVMFKSGLSEAHLINAFPEAHSNMLTSVVRFHLHYQMSRFMNKPDELDRYLTDDDTRTIRKHTPVRETWVSKTAQTHVNIGTWYYGLPAAKRKRIRRQKYHRTKYGGTFIVYEYLTGSEPNDVKNDYKYLIPETSHGLTTLGQKLFQQSAEAFVYSVLGAQVKTRWSITAQGQRAYRRRSTSTRW
jgi:hypothetical protein